MDKSLSIPETRLAELSTNSGKGWREGEELREKAGEGGKMATVTWNKSP
jgi:hypothetical protein